MASRPLVAPVAFLLLLATALSIVSAVSASNCQTTQSMAISARTDVNLSINATAGGSCLRANSTVIFSASGSVSGFLVSVVDLQLSYSAYALLNEVGSPYALLLTTSSSDPNGGRHAIFKANGQRFQALLKVPTPAAAGSSARLSVEPIGEGACPPGWRRADSVCYGDPVKNDKVNYKQAAVLCRLLQANLAINFADSDVLESAVSDSKPHWVGVVEYRGKNPKLYFLTGEPFYRSLSEVPSSASYCPASSGDCNCVYYQGGSFFRASCDSRFAQLCSTPVGGTPANKFYDRSSISTNIKQWTYDHPSALMLLLRRYWPAFVVLGLIIVGSSIGFRVYRMRATRGMHGRQMPVGGVVASAAVAPPPGSFPTQPPPPGSFPTQPPAAGLSQWQQPHTMEPQPPPYNYFNNAGYQADAINSGATAVAAAPNGATPSAPSETKK